MAPPVTLFPVAEREIYVNSELSPGTVPALPGLVLPLRTFKASDKPAWLEDNSWQGNMGDIQGIYQGPLISGLDFGGDFFADSFPYLLKALMGDYTAIGTAASPAAATTSGVAAGALALPVVSGGASFTAGMAVWIEDAGTPAASEVCIVGTGSTSTSVVLAAPGTRFAHLTATPFTNTTGTYTHVFTQLNGLTGAVNGSGQPGTLCLTDRTGIQATGLAAQYAYTCPMEISLTANAEKLLAWTCKTINQTRVIAASPIGVVNPSTVQTYPSWRGIMGIGGPASGGTLVKNLAEYEITLTRQAKAYNSLQGSQLPYVIGRGKMGANGKMMAAPAIDESFYLAMIGNTQPQTQFVATNGLSGTALCSVQVDVGLSAYDTADLTDGDELFGYEVPFKCVNTAASFGGITMTGASGAKGPIKITVINNVPTY